MSSFRMTHSFLSSHRNVQKDMSREQVVQPKNVQSENVQSENVQSENVQSENVQSENVQSENVQFKNVQFKNVQFKNVQFKNIRSEDVQPENVLSKNLRKNGGQTLIHPKTNRTTFINPAELRNDPHHDEMALVQDKSSSASGLGIPIAPSFTLLHAQSHTC